MIYYLYFLIITLENTKMSSFCDYLNVVKNVDELLNFFSTFSWDIDVFTKQDTLSWESLFSELYYKNPTKMIGCTIDWTGFTGVPKNLVRHYNYDSVPYTDAFFRILSSNPTLPLCAVMNGGRCFPWCWTSLAMLPALTPECVINNPRYPWDYVAISKRWPDIVFNYGNCVYGDWIDNDVMRSYVSRHLNLGYHLYPPEILTSPNTYYLAHKKHVYLDNVYLAKSGTTNFRSSCTTPSIFIVIGMSGSRYIVRWTNGGICKFTETKMKSFKLIAENVNIYGWDEICKVVNRTYSCNAIGHLISYSTNVSPIYEYILALVLDIVASKVPIPIPVHIIKLYIDSLVNLAKKNENIHETEVSFIHNDRKYILSKENILFFQRLYINDCVEYELSKNE